MASAQDEQNGCLNGSHRTIDGTTRHVEVFSASNMVAGKSLLCSTIHDVAERRSTEKEREAEIDNLQAILHNGAV